MAESIRLSLFPTKKKKIECYFFVQGLENVLNWIELQGTQKLKMSYTSLSKCIVDQVDQKINIVNHILFPDLMNYFPFPHYYSLKICNLFCTVFISFLNIRVHIHVHTDLKKKQQKCFNLEQSVAQFST